VDTDSLLHRPSWPCCWVSLRLQSFKVEPTDAETACQAWESGEGKFTASFELGGIKRASESLAHGQVYVRSGIPAISALSLAAEHPVDTNRISGNHWQDDDCAVEQEPE
jgi:hypothetical protein